MAKRHKRYYMWGDGVVWRIPIALLRVWTPDTHDKWYDTLISRGVGGATYNYGTERWSKLPKGIYDSGGVPYSGSNNAEIAHFDDVEFLLPYWQGEL